MSETLLAGAIAYRRRAWLLRLARRVGGEALLFWLARRCYHLSIEGAERIPRQGACLLPFNHVSNIADALVYLVIRTHRPDVHLFTWRLVGSEIAGLLEAFWPSGNPAQLLFAHKRPAASLGELLHARQVLLSAGALALAPEGELTWDGRLQYPLAPGTAWLALHTAVPLVPVVSVGGYDIQPVWQMEKVRLTGRIKIRVGQPFQLCDHPLAQVTDELLQAGTQRIWDELAGLLLSDQR